MRACLSAFLCVCCALCLEACGLLASRPADFALEPLRVAPAVLGEHTVEQRLTIRWPGGERSIEAVLETASGRLQLVLLAFGMRLASLEYGGDGSTLIEQRFVPHAPEGRRILNDLLMIATPLEDLRRALPSGVSVLETRPDADGKRRREIAEGGMTKVVIDYETESPWQGIVRFRYPAMRYELILESHEI